jgi:RimJ/RimL family protein N-acetyltransferase
MSMPKDRNPSIRLRTARLELDLRSPDDLRADLAAMPPEMRAEVSPPWIARVEAAREADPWFHGFRALDGDGVAVGQGAFKGPPADGVVEVAYAVEPDREGQGYATEIAAALTTFALSRPEVEVVRAHTLAEGIASQRVLLKCGFERIGEVVDPEDGPVVRFEKWLAP